MSVHSVLSPTKGPSRIGSVWAQPSYIRRNTWGNWSVRGRGERVRRWKGVKRV